MGFEASTPVTSGQLLPLSGGASQTQQSRPKYDRTKDLNGDNVVDDLEEKALKMAACPYNGETLSNSEKKVLRSYLEHGQLKVWQFIAKMQTTDPCDLRNLDYSSISGIEERLLNLSKVAVLGGRVGLSYDDMKKYLLNMVNISSYLPRVVSIIQVNCADDISSDSSLYVRRNIKDIMLGSGMIESEVSGIFTRLGYEYPYCLRRNDVR